MPYVDGFVIPVPKSKLEDYKAMAKLGLQGLDGSYGATQLRRDASATTCPMARRPCSRARSRWPRTTK